MRHLTSLLLTTALLLGCATMKSVGEGLNPGELTYSPSIVVKPPTGVTKDIGKSVVLNDWLWQKIEKHNKTEAADPRLNAGCMKGAGVYTLLHCFGNIRSEEQMAYRNNLISLSIYMADNQCNKRIDGIGGYLAGGNTLQSMAADVVGAVGIVSTDAITSRIASGVGVGVKSLWENSKEEFVAGANFGTLTANIKQSHKDQKDALIVNMKKTYNEWPLEQALIEIDKYDNTCDLFN